MTIRTSARFALLSLGAGVCLSSLSYAAPVNAQDTGATSREVVQPLPSAEVQRLNRALRQLARSPRRLSTLIEAGNAAMALGDYDAAIGFFGRAQAIAPTDPSVKMGMAAVFLRSDRPIEALRLFSEAEAAGASSRDVLPDRGLAFDLVGNNTEAQNAYRSALVLRNDNEVVRRLALSQAIAGNRDAFEATLRPLLEDRDFAAFRTQAFGLAILGQQDEAAAIADAVMPRDLAARMTPYLAFMPRLTKAQQAAAANLGIFPAAADVGRDDPRIAQFAAQGSAIAQAADTRLAPSGEPLGSPQESSLAQVRTAQAAEVQTGSVQTAPTPTAPTPTALVPTEPAQTNLPLASPDSADVVRVSRASEGGEVAESSAAPRPGFDLARAGRPSRANPVVQATKSNVADAFADLGSASTRVTRGGGGAVDLAAIEIPREARATSEPEPTKLVHPSRNWVQVATGKDRSALKFDWRRFSRTAPDQLGDYTPHVVAWGESNRLLAGPVPNQSEARALVNALKDKGLDSFTYASPEGQEIQELK